MELILQVPNNKPLSGSQSEELDQVDYEINDIPPRPSKPNVSRVYY